MDDLHEQEFFRVRFRFLDLIKSFFAAEPDAEMLGRWRGTFSALAKEQVSPRFDGAVKEVSRALGEKTLKEIQEEYYKLFINPFDGTMVETTASYYLNGRSYDQALVDVRGLLGEAGLEKDTTVTEPEDSLIVLLDSLLSLVEEERTGGGEKIQELQSRLLVEFLLPFVEKFTATLKASEHADFYYLCSRVVGGYLDLERNLVTAR